ncbi:putative tRNA methyltransferase 112-like protein [Naja naja]|nr:putative tRNA methyltransferase 112-like protein [Naja naja]
MSEKTGDLCLHPNRKLSGRDFLPRARVLACSLSGPRKKKHHETPDPQHAHFARAGRAARRRVSPSHKEFTARMVPKIEWGALVGAAESLGHRSDLPSELIPDYEKNEDFLRKVHHVLMEVEVIEGILKCPDTGREFPITKGIPNMLLSEDET